MKATRKTATMICRMPVDRDHPQQYHLVPIQIKTVKFEPVKTRVKVTDASGEHYKTVTTFRVPKAERAVRTAKRR